MKSFDGALTFLIWTLSAKCTVRLTEKCNSSSLPDKLPDDVGMSDSRFVDMGSFLYVKGEQTNSSFFSLFSCEETFETGDALAVRSAGCRCFKVLACVLVSKSVKLAFLSFEASVFSFWLGEEFVSEIDICLVCFFSLTSSPTFVLGETSCCPFVMPNIFKNFDNKRLATSISSLPLLALVDSEWTSFKIATKKLISSTTVKKRKLCM